jgi:O-antigen biosynthesis protein
MESHGMHPNFNPLEYPVCLSFPLWIQETAWAGHIPFAMFVVAAAKPRILVELGAWRGVSYCAFCQAVKESNLDTRCYAVDTWKGDEHTGSLSEEALHALRTHHDPLYSAFSRLVQTTFDEALEHFSDSTVDLLHIDGFHTFEAVSHDFETWLPKMSERGIMLFHDTNVRERGFGVFRFWEDAALRFPSFVFPHSHGLGVLAVGKEIPAELRFLFEADEAQTPVIREFFNSLGSRIEMTIQCREKERLTLEQKQVIDVLQTYEQVVNQSRIMRGYRILKDEGIASLVKKASGKTKQATIKE